MGRFQEIHKQQVDIRAKLYELAKAYVEAYEEDDSELGRWYGFNTVKPERALAEFFGWERYGN